MIEIPLKLLDEGLAPPQYAHPGDAGLDLPSRVELTLEPGQRATVPTGVAVAIPKGYAGLVLPRSGLASKYGIQLVNSPGLIDSGYRGEIRVVLLNSDKRASFTINRGDRIAQLMIQRVEDARVVLVQELDETVRGSGGFGSTGTDKR